MFCGLATGNRMLPVVAAVILNRISALQRTLPNEFPKYCTMMYSKYSNISI